MKKREEGKHKILVSTLVIVGMLIACSIPLNVSGAGDLPFYDIEQDSLGNYHKAFIDNSVGNYEIYYTNDIGGSYPQDWNPPTRITYTDNASLLLDLGIYLPTDTMFIIWDEVLGGLGNASNPTGPTYYTISWDYGENWTESQRSYENITLKYSTFNPLIEEPNLPILPANWADPCAYYIVQLKTPMIQEWWDGIEAVGGIFCGYLNYNAYIIWMTPSVKVQVEQLPFVRWIDYYHPLYKIEPGLLENTGNIELNVMVIEETGALQNLNKVTLEIEALGGIITYNGSDNFIIRTLIDASKIEDISYIPEVDWIDEVGLLSVDMNYIREFTGVDLLHSNDFRGEGIIGEVKDAGIDLKHHNLKWRVTLTQGAADESMPAAYHGTCTTGVIFSDSSGWDGGILPGGTGAFANMYQTGRYQSINQLANWGGVFQSNSWHQGYTNSAYSAFSAENDRCVLDHDITMVYSASNSYYGVGEETLSTDSVAKNVICVGAVNHYDDTDMLNDEWVNGGRSNTPSQGPASDGRIKPDLCGPFDYGFVTDSIDGDGVDGYRPGDHVYREEGDELFGGTSLAAPVVAGGAGLVYEMYRENHFGNNPTGEYPHASTVKALLIANAHQYDLSRANRYQQGWGTIDINKIWDIGSDHFIVNEDVLANRRSYIKYDVWVDGSQPLKISLVWTDPEGLPADSIALQNFLGLLVYPPSYRENPDRSITYQGNNGLYTSLWSQPGVGGDMINNVQNVFIENPEEGLWSIRVLPCINIDGYEETPELDQSFALVVSGCESPSWSQFGQNHRNTGYTPTNSPDSPDVEWEFDAGPYAIYTSPVHSDGKVFVGSESGLYCLPETDPTPGDGIIDMNDIIWKFEPNDPSPWPMIHSSPAVSNGRVYVAVYYPFQIGKIYCLRIDEQPPIDRIVTMDDIVWHYDTTWVTASLTIANNKLFVNTHPRGGYGKLLCLDLDGNFIWDYPTGGGDWSSPAVAYGKVFVVDYWGCLYALKENNGAFIWSFQLASQGVFASSPAVWDHKVFIGGGNKVYALDENGNGDGTTNIIWYSITEGAVVSSPAIAFDSVYVGSCDGPTSDFYCLPVDDPTPGDGEITPADRWWVYDIGSTYNSPAVSGDGRVFVVTSEDGVLHALDAYSPATLWSYPLGGDDTISSPAIAIGNIYIGDYDGNVWAFT